MLPNHYRFTVTNNTGVNIASPRITIHRRGWKFDSNGELVYEASGENATLVYANAGTVNNSASDTSATQDNTSTKYLGAEFTLSLDAPASSNGVLTITMQVSYDKGTTWTTVGNTARQVAIRATAEAVYRMDWHVQ